MPGRPKSSLGRRRNGEGFAGLLQRFFPVLRRADARAYGGPYPIRTHRTMAEVMRDEALSPELRDVLAYLDRRQTNCNRVIHTNKPEAERASIIRQELIVLGDAFRAGLHHGEAEVREALTPALSRGERESADPAADQAAASANARPQAPGAERRSSVEDDGPDGPAKGRDS